MDRSLPWHTPGSSRADQAAEESAGTSQAARATAQFGGDNHDQPILVAVIQGPVEAEMAKDALAEARIPAYVKQNSLGQVYGLTVGAFGSAEVWALPTVAEQAREILIGIGLLEPQTDE